jgi:CheY-like chemotaxis protein
MSRFLATVLVVEDDPEIVMLAREVLGQSGFCTLAAADGRTALSVLSSIKVDLILLDLTMPEMNGWEFLAARRGNPSLSSIPVVLISGYGRWDQLDEIVDWEEVLAKPFAMSELVEVVARRCAVALTPPRSSTAG